VIDCAYVQRKNDDWLNENAYNIVYGLRLLGIEVRPFDFKELEDLPLTKGTMVHGGIYTVRRALEKLGCAPPDVCGGLPPTELMPFYGRKVWASTMLEIRRRLETDDPVFVKPLRSQKAFNGHVTSGELRDLIQTAGFDDDFEVLCSEPVQFVTEYRAFVNKQHVIGLKHYKGDFKRFIDFDVVNAARCAWAGPISYSLDFGLDVYGRTLLVEINDGFSLGSYGLPSVQYANFVIDRWEEMTASLP
jgi:hypothetical protein